jgi:hypothetical protein
MQNPGKRLMHVRLSTIYGVMAEESKVGFFRRGKNKRANLPITSFRLLRGNGQTLQRWWHRRRRRLISAGDIVNARIASGDSSVWAVMKTLEYM